MGNSDEKFHFIAIGGIGMSALAKYLLESGCEVSGSDIRENACTEQLKELGARIFIGHDEKNIPQNASVVISTAIKDDNAEYIRAKELGLKVYHRSDVLRLISEGFAKPKTPLFIGFLGTHGKTTTSGMCAYVLEKAGYKPSFAVGGIIPKIGTNSKSAGDDFFIAELDESDGSFVDYKPAISVINNLEADHLDFYTNGLKDIFEKFKVFLAQLKPGAEVIINNDCPGNLELMKQNPETAFITFGLSEADYTAKNVRYHNMSSDFEVFYKGTKLGDISLNIPGEHNVYNALAVAAAITEAGIDFASAAKYFAGFTGMGRRFQLCAEFNGIKVYDDYAHHPTEIETTLKSAKLGFDGRLVAIFQPHRYSRLKGLWNEFLNAFEYADKVIILDVYSAGEPFNEQFNSAVFAKEFSHPDCTYIEGSIKDAAVKLLPILKKNDIVITMGAGDITKLGKELAELVGRSGIA